LSPYITKWNEGYTADVFISIRNTVKNQECFDEMKYFHDNMINFKAYVMVGCVTALTKDKIIAENNMHHFMIGSQGWDPSLKGQAYDEEYSSVGMFGTAGIYSPREFAESWKTKFNEEATHIGAAAPVTPFYYFHRDFIKASGVVANLINNFNQPRTPETSYYGLLASDDTGTNSFQEWMAIQIMSDETIKIVNQDGKGRYPAPF